MLRGFYLVETIVGWLGCFCPQDPLRVTGVPAVVVRGVHEELTENPTLQALAR